MRGENRTRIWRRGRSGAKSRNILKCLCSGQPITEDEMVRSSESTTATDNSVSIHSSRAGGTPKKPDIGNIEEAESSLRESGCLNYEEARALLGRYEYQKGNIEAALHVFEGIDISAVISKMKTTLSIKGETRKRRSRNFATPPMSIHATRLLLEAILLKSKSLQALGRYKEAAQSCKVILDIVESSLPAGLPENFGADCKLQEILSKAVELLPELWKLADSPSEAIFSYRRALLYQWNLDAQTLARIQKEFAIFLLYSGTEANPPTLLSQLDSSFVPRNNFEEAILLLMILLRKVSLKIIEWDPSILEHLAYALSLSGGLKALAEQVEAVRPGTIDSKEMYYALALCYYGEGDELDALNLLQKLLSRNEDPTCFPGLLLASKICADNLTHSECGSGFARKALENSQGKCDYLVGVANYLLGASLASRSRLVVTDFERTSRQADGLRSMEIGGAMTRLSNEIIVYHLSLENAEQRKLDAALHYAKCLIKLESGSSIRGWVLMARILSAQKRFVDAENILNVALDHTGKWDQGELLRAKAKLQVSQGQLKKAIETYTKLLAIFQVRMQNIGSGKGSKDDWSRIRSLEQETWHDLGLIYIKLSQWLDAETCLAKSKAITYYSASRLHTAGLLYEAKGLHREALGMFGQALAVDPNHVPSLVSMAVILRRICSQSPTIRSLLMQALQLNRTNVSAWYNLGLFYKDQGPASAMEAAECFEAATLLDDTSPIEPFR